MHHITKYFTRRNSIALLAGLLLIGGGSAFATTDYDFRATTNPYTAKCPGNTLAYGSPGVGPPFNTKAARIAVFGQGGKNIARTKFLGKSVRVNKKIVPCLKAVEWDLKRKGYNRSNYRLKDIGGYRKINNANPQNKDNLFHGYGGAIDINGGENHYCPGERSLSRCRHTVPTSWVKAFERHGFFWGGNYNSLKDTQHFEWHGQKP